MREASTPQRRDPAPARCKVLHILHAFSHGGLENGLVNIINGSPPDLEHELCLLTAAGEFIQRLEKPVHCYELHKQPGNSLKTVVQIARVIRRSGADIVHTRNWAAFDGVLASCLCPGVVVLHGEHGRDLGDPEGGNRRRNSARRLLSGRVRHFTTVSEDLRRWLIQVVGIPSSKIVLIPNGVDTGRFSPRRDPSLRRELGIAPDEFVIGAIGRLDPVKNHAGILRAFAAMGPARRNSRVVIVGDGPERLNLEKTIGALGLGSAVILTGYRVDVYRFYGLFDVFVLNSFAEGMSNTLLEAMACGLPVVSTSVGASSSVVSDGERGRLAEVGNDAELAGKIQSYKERPDLRAVHGAAARQFVEQEHSLSSMVGSYARLYSMVPLRRRV